MNWLAEQLQDTPEKIAAVAEHKKKMRAEKRKAKAKATTVPSPSLIDVFKNIDTIRAKRRVYGKGTSTRGGRRCDLHQK